MIQILADDLTEVNFNLDIEKFIHGSPANWSGITYGPRCTNPEPRLGVLWPFLPNSNKMAAMFPLPAVCGTAALPAHPSVVTPIERRTDPCTIMHGTGRKHTIT